MTSHTKHDSGVIIKYSCYEKHIYRNAVIRNLLSMKMLVYLFGVFPWVCPLWKPQGVAKWQEFMGSVSLPQLLRI
jgi:hypothetical protein